MAVVIDLKDGIGYTVKYRKFVEIWGEMNEKK